MDPPVHFRSMRAMRRRSTASCSWISSTIRLLFAYHRTNRPAVQATIAVGPVKHTRLFFLTLFAVVLAARLCHIDILWAEETLPLAAAAQFAHGKVLYRDLWFDKPPLLAWTYIAWGARDGFPLRLAGAIYALLACWLAWRFARDLWGRREGFWAAGLLAFYLIFDIPSAVTPLAADLLMLAPHIAAVWLAWRGRAFWSGVLAGIAFLVNAKGLFVLAACIVWNLRALPWLLAGFAIPNAMAAAVLWGQGALRCLFRTGMAVGQRLCGRHFPGTSVAERLAAHCRLAWLPRCRRRGRVVVLVARSARLTAHAGLLGSRSAAWR